MRVLNEQPFYEICHEIWNTKGPGNMKFEWNLTEIWNLLAKFEISLRFCQVPDPSKQLQLALNVSAISTLKRKSYTME